VCGLVWCKKPAAPAYGGQIETGGLHPARMVCASLEEISPEECIKLITAYTPGLQGQIQFQKMENPNSGDMMVFGMDDEYA
jgi:hypothetical protein